MSTLDKQIESYHSYMKLKNYSNQTIASYLRTVRMFYDFRGDRKMRGRINEEHAKQYLLMRIESGCSWSTINCDYSALRKYFQNIINARWSIKKIPRPQKERTLPEILSQEEVVKLIEHAPTYKHQVFLTFIYGTGLRLSEALNITFEDIDGNRLQIKINKGKGAKDRVVQIPECLLNLLRTYYRRLKPKDYLFNGLKKGSKYSHRAAQWSIIRARELAGIKKTASIHTLRNCYATHHIENGTDLVFLQEQLGHKHLKTTARYVRLCMERYRRIDHPIAHMEIKYR